MSKFLTVYMVYELDRELSIGFSYCYGMEDNAINHMIYTPDNFEVWYIPQTYELEEDSQHDCGDDE